MANAANGRSAGDGFPPGRGGPPGTDSSQPLPSPGNSVTNSFQTDPGGSPCDAVGLVPTTQDIAGTHSVTYAIQSNTCPVPDPAPYSATASFETVSPIQLNVRFQDAPNNPIRIDDYDQTTGDGSGSTGLISFPPFDVSEDWQVKFSFDSSNNVTMTGKSTVSYFRNSLLDCLATFNISF